MEYLVTGGAEFIGCNLVERLAGQGIKNEPVPIFYL